MNIKLKRWRISSW